MVFLLMKEVYIVRDNAPKPIELMEHISSCKKRDLPQLEYLLGPSGTRNWNSIVSRIEFERIQWQILCSVKMMCYLIWNWIWRNYIICIVRDVCGCVQCVYVCIVWVQWCMLICIICEVTQFISKYMEFQLHIFYMKLKLRNLWEIWMVIQFLIYYFSITKH